MGGVLGSTESFASICILRSRLISAYFLERNFLSGRQTSRLCEIQDKRKTSYMLNRKKPLLAWEVVTIEIKMSHCPFNSLST